MADKNIEKLHCIAPNVYCAGAGTAADCNHVTDMVASAVKLHRYDTGRQTRVITVTTLLKNHLQRYQGYIGAALIIGGVDLNGPQLTTVSQLNQNYAMFCFLRFFHKVRQIHFLMQRWGLVR